MSEPTSAVVTGEEPDKPHCRQLLDQSSPSTLRNEPTMTQQATKTLFAAINDYGMLASCRKEDKEAAAISVMRTALADGADWRALLGPGLRDAAFAAANCASREPLELLLTHGVPLDHQAGSDGYLIHRAASFSSRDVIQMLVDRGVSPDLKDQNGRTPLQHARAWKHGKDAVSLLLRLLKAHGCAPARAKRGDDLRPEAMASETPSAELASVFEAHFVERLGATYKDVLGAVIERGENTLTAEALALVSRVTAAKPKQKTLQAQRRLRLIHHGDLEIAGDVNVMTLVVTGSLRVAGRITNYEGCPIAVGGDVTATAVWSEGPFVVGGDVRATTAFAGAYADYGTTIGGTLETPTLIQLDHAIQVGRVKADATVTERARIPPALMGPLGIKKL